VGKLAQVYKSIQERVKFDDFEKKAV